MVTGNTAIDALKLTVQEEDYHHEVLDQLDPAKKSSSSPCIEEKSRPTHASGLWGSKKWLIKNQIEVVYPVHLSPAVQEVAYDLWEIMNESHLIEPLDVFDFHNLASRSYFIMSDSGGVSRRGAIIRKTSIGIAANRLERPEGGKRGL